ncbi:high-potential iron-sulfur protein [Salinicola sp. DM10]|uniref:high-potential iron-sulfur protein n=1 Tax=Salinicola sp. DM10 TaxID=2815721 RepID=UPI001A8C7D8F|nr:high-potential iron-sulfur protein [Salinicola sp. DM10]MCE3028205.1 high-potential iron-sulfur protein [Salinicola sp. DM10]
MSIDRRRFLCRGAALSAGLLLVPGWRAWAQSAPLLDPAARQARAVRYVEQASAAQDDPAYRAGRHCANCDFFGAGQRCALFPEHRVSPDGWCMSWTSE